MVSSYGGVIQSRASWIQAMLSTAWATLASDDAVESRWVFPPVGHEPTDAGHVDGVALVPVPDKGRHKFF